MYYFENLDERGKQLVWAKGEVITGYHPDTWRQDICGYAMKYQDHGDRNSEYGWEVDHILPVSKGGTDNLDNLQPLHWENNATKGDQYPWDCEGV